MSSSTQYQVREPMPGVVYAPPADLRRYLDAGALTRETMPDAFRASFAAHADRLALRGSEGEVSYAELDALTRALTSPVKPLAAVVGPRQAVLSQANRSGPHHKVTGVESSPFNASLLSPGGGTYGRLQPAQASNRLERGR